MKSLIINDLKDTKKPLDIHLMVNNPEEYLETLIKSLITNSGLFKISYKVIPSFNNVVYCAYS